MASVTLDFRKTSGTIKPMHAVNNGPVPERADQTRGNFKTYKAARIPYMRNHDAAFCASYGGEHTVDVHMIFPDFDADPYDPASYDFTLTDEYNQRCLDAGTKIFYRLGSKIEHASKKYGTLVPRDFKKWAIICEHIIRHMNEGWADGHNFGIEYWEIWNEPDLDDDDSKNKRCWGGTEAEFFVFFETAAKHLKGCFPDLKIGGPAVCGRGGWSERFLTYAEKHKIPLDFFSWHTYPLTPDQMAKSCDWIRTMLDQHGYQNAESILDEYNFIIDWSPRFVESFVAINTMPGAAFTASCMLACQQKPLDMLMYYDARPGTGFNGMWDFITLRPLKGYYPFVMFSKLYELSDSVPVSFDTCPEIKAAGAQNDGRQAFMLSYFQYETGESVTFDVLLPGWKGDAVKASFLDKDRTMEEEILPVKDGKLTLTFEPNTVVFFENI